MKEHKYKAYKEEEQQTMGLIVWLLGALALVVTMLIMLIIGLCA